MKIRTPLGTIIISHSGNNRVWYFRTYPFKVVWYTEAVVGKQSSKRFSQDSELSQFLLDKWGADVVASFQEAQPIPVGD
jgi:hypothetical protein